MACDGTPGRTRVVGHPDAGRALREHADEDARCPGGRFRACCVEDNPTDTKRVRVVSYIKISVSHPLEYGNKVVEKLTGGIGRVDHKVARRSEARHARPSETRVGRAPEPVARAGAEVEDLIVARVDDETLARSTAGHVPAGLEWERDSLEGRTLVGRLENRGIVGVPGVGVHSNFDVDIVGVNWVSGDRFSVNGFVRTSLDNRRGGKVTYTPQ